MPEERVTISTSSRLHPDEVARHTFGTTRRGFDPAEVRSFLEHVARELSAASDREQDLRRALGEAEHRAENPVLDEATLTASLGLETARVLRSAHEAAADLVGKAENDAARLRAQAQEEAEALKRHTEQHAHDRSAEADAAATELLRRAHDEATSRVEGAKLEAEALVTQTRAECRAMVQEAQELRAKVLADLTRRRRVLHSQIEQLRAGRERLAETIGDVRNAVDTITDELFRAEDEARLAAEVAGRQVAQEELAELADAGASADDGDTPVDFAADSGTEPDTRQSVEELFARLRAEAGAQPAPDEGPAPPGAVSSSPVSDEVIESVRILPATATATPASEARSASSGSAGTPDGAGGAGSGASTAPKGNKKTAERAPKPERGPASAAPVARPGPSGAEGPSGPGAKTPDTAGATGTAEIEVEVEVDEMVRILDPAVVRRDAVLNPLVANLARRLKRALQDDQNDILDRLRAKGGWAPGVLPSEDEHAQRYVQVAGPQLQEAAAAGATFAGGKADDAAGVDDVAASLASEIVTPLRRRLEDAGPSVEEGDESALVELVGAAFREWKGARTERLAGDRTVFAFARAALGAVPVGTMLRWVVDDDVAQCPDCDDNALAGAVASPEEFPTGHRHPPAHAGCRCLLVPANA